MPLPNLVGLKAAYRTQVDNSKARGKKFILSFEEWMNIWEESGKLPKRGRKKGNYCMCRFDDKGAYEVGNVFIDTVSANTHDGNIGKVMSSETRVKIGLSKVGVARPDIEAKHGKRVVMLTKDGVLVEEFSSAGRASRETGISQPTITMVCNKKQNRVSAGGFKWLFADDFYAIA